MRGENFYLWITSSRDRGSSLLARGKLPSTCGHGGPHRIIPACAGKTYTPHNGPTGPLDHPCLRGENAHTGAENGPPRGSSLLARGKLVQLQATQVINRIIPACAGKTYEPWTAAPGHADHPCLRGENRALFCPYWAAAGSSLLARGKPAL